MENLNRFINEEVNNGVFPGMTYSVINGDRVEYGAVGYKELVPSKVQIEEDTLYDIASLSKVVSVVTIMSRLIDQKKIDINDKVNKYLSDFNYDDVTILNLLTHTSGLPADLEGKEIIPRDEVLRQVYAAEKEYETGTKVIYSDLGYILLGELISKVCQKPLDEVAKEEVFDPLNMNSTCYNPKDKDACAPTEIIDARGIIKGIVHDEKACSLGGAAGNAGVFTNTKDLSNFVSMILNDGMFEGKRFLSKEIIDLWFEPIVYESQNDRYRSLCWIVGSNGLVIKKDGNVISFNGFTGPSISVDRDRGVGIVLLTNRVHPTRNNFLLSKERPNITSEIYHELGLDEEKSF